ncbi:hypothetical protein GCM10028807_54680 [Spirosoma daeguense]
MADFGEEAGKALTEVSKDIYNDLIKKSFSHLGTFAGDLIECALRFSYPMRLSNAKRRMEFERNLKLLSESFESIPEAKRIETPPELLIPTFEKLTYITNEDIAKLFINLLNKASNVDTISQAHPNFVSLIEKISADEAKIIRLIYAQRLFRFAYVILYKEHVLTKHQIIVERYLTDLSLIVGSLQFPENISFYISNLIALGIIADMLPQQILYDAPYNAINAIHSDFLNHLNIQKPSHQEIKQTRASIEVTEFGMKFMRTCFT